MLFNKNGQGYALPNFLTSHGIVPDPRQIAQQINGNAAPPPFMGAVNMGAWGYAPMRQPAISARATNPARGNRVFVPGSYFEIIGRR